MCLTEEDLTLAVVFFLVIFWADRGIWKSFKNIFLGFKKLQNRENIS